MKRRIRSNSRRVGKPRRSFGELAAISGNISQVLVFLLAVFGYFYTVVPVYQNQKLNEDNARLEEENGALWQKINMAKSEFEVQLKEHTEALVVANEKLQGKLRDYNELKVAVDQARERERIAVENQQRESLAAAADLKKRQAEASEYFRKSAEEKMNRIVAQELGDEIADGAETRSEKYISVPKDDIFDQIEQVKDVDVERLVNKVFRNPVDYVLPVVARLIDKYSRIDDPKSKLKVSKLLDIEQACKTQRHKYELLPEKRSAMLVRIRLYLSDQRAANQTFSLFYNDRWWDNRRVFVPELFALMRGIPDTLDVINGLLGPVVFVQIRDRASPR